ncbi:MAG TPA: DUF2167 domain-containing protein [Bryobacteraceae bacterium]|nr:DUF2167 domain-containing protein [Bryobacteraceae bacterium]
MRLWLLLFLCPSAVAQDAPEIRWRFGPLEEQIGEGARLRLRPGTIWAGGSEARRFLEFTGNPPDGGEIGIAGPANMSWFAVVSWRTYASLGFEVARPDSRRIAEAIKSGAATANQERGRKGRETLEVLDWTGRPVFDERLGRLEFKLKTQESGGRAVENRFVYLLGRAGVVEVELVTEMGTDTAGFESLLDGVTWRPGEEYERPTDWKTIWVTGLAAAVAAALGIRLWRQRGQ